MKFLNFSFLLIVSLFILQGCGTKRQYFEPKDVSYAISYDGTLPSSIIDVTRGGATLKNGEIISKSGLKNIKLPTGYTFLGNDKDKYLATSTCGDLIVVNNNSKIIYNRKFDSQVATASIKGSKIALVLSTNRILLIDLKSNKEILNSKQDDVYALDSRIAAPIFLDTLAIFPTLDGKLLIVDPANGKIIKSIVVGNEKFFGNIIYLDVLDNRLVVATKKRVISISPKSMSILDEDVKDVIVLKNRVFIFTKDGTVILTNADLKVLKKKKFPFAVFAGAIYGDFVYMIERGGYLIATDVDLISTNVYKMPDNIDSYLFFTKNALYYKNKYFKLVNKK
ncbi:MAG: PQQ-like beta-propeller repeat protein [Campylobacteraceae bacterium]|nr:PQQ-like beta-propeller repeat protein [Campylobacteraceae bacterium]